MSEKNDTIILAAPIKADGSLGGPFGKASKMVVTTIKDSQIIDWQIHDVGWDVLHDQSEHGKHHARIVTFMKDNNVNRVVFSHMGPPMQNTLHKLGLALIQAEFEGQDAKELMILAAALDLENYEQ